MHPSTSTGYRCDQLQDLILSTFFSANDKIDDNFKEELLRQQLYLVAIFVLSRLMNLGQGTSYFHTEGNYHNVRSSSSTSLHQYLHYKPTALATSWPPSKDRQATTFSKVHDPQISSTHLFDPTSISGPLNSNVHSLVVKPCITRPSGPRHIATSPPSSRT